MILPVRDYALGKRFYEATLGALGYTLLLDWPDRRRAWFGIVGSPSSLWLKESDAAGSLEVCLAAECPEEVEGFHSQAVGVGARSTWEPGVRPSSAATTTPPACTTPTATRSRSSTGVRSPRAP